MKRLFFVLTVLLLPSTIWAETKRPVTKTKSSSSKPAVRKVSPPPDTEAVKPHSLAGGKTLEEFQNNRADQLNLIRFSTRFEFDYLVESGYIVPLPDNICIDIRLFDEWRYTMPQVVEFLQETDRAFFQRFGELCYRHDSASRTRDKQLEIILGTGTRENGNDKPNRGAGPPDGPRSSLHMRGAAVDISKRHLPSIAVTWLRDYLTQKDDLYNIDVIEEWRNEVFHIVIYPKDAIRPIFPE